MEHRFLKATQAYYEMEVLLRIDRAGPLTLPLDPGELPLPSLEHLPIARLIEERILTVESAESGQVVALTADGRAHMRRLAIDYHLELMALRKTSDDFFRERVTALEAAGCRRIVLYGASDTARALLGFLEGSPVSVAGIVDDDAAKHGARIAGISIAPPSACASLDFDSLVVTTVAFEEKILRERIPRLGLPGERRVIGLFDIGYVKGATPPR